MADRERSLNRAFVELADTLVSGYDVADLLHRLVIDVVDLLNASQAGLLLADHRGSLTVLASSSERTRLLELFQLQNDEGPCLDCFRTGRPVIVPDLAREAERWPLFAPAAQHEGFVAVHAVPLRLRDEVIGGLNIFMDHTGALPPDDLAAAQALADIATIGILQERAIQRGEFIVEQLQGALNSRIVIEQAKGMLAAMSRGDIDAAFRQLRHYSRSTRAPLSQVARDIVEGRLDGDLVLATTTYDRPQSR